MQRKQDGFSYIDFATRANQGLHFILIGCKVPIDAETAETVTSLLKRRGPFCFLGWGQMLDRYSFSSRIDLVQTLLKFFVVGISEGPLVAGVESECI